MRITGKLALRIAALTLALIATGLGVTSCQQILGDVPDLDVFERPLLPDGGFGGGVSVSQVCELSTFRCTGSKREICTQLADSGIGWMTQEDCLSNELCEQGLLLPVIACVRPACSLDDGQCSDATPERCKENLTGYEAYGEVCLNAGQCSTLLEDCPNGPPCCAPACTSGTIRCNAGTMERCAADQESWELIYSCATPEVCQLGLDLCSSAPGDCACGAVACQAGESRCLPDGTLEICNAGQTGWNFVNTCANLDLCELGRTLSPVACEEPECDVGQYNCTAEGVLQPCRANRIGFEPGTACPGGRAFCNAGQGRCDETPCGPGDEQCNGATIERCLDDRSGFAPTDQVCATAALCGPNQLGVLECTQPSCNVDEFNCFGGTQLQRCNDARSGFIPVGAACPRPDLCSADRRRCDLCVPNQRECTFPDLGNSRTCNAQGTAFGPLTNCPLGCVAATGACNTCTVGELTCAGATLQRCNDGRSRSPVMGNVVCDGGSRVSCQNGQLQRQNCGAAGCNQQRLQCNECSGTQRRCAGGATFQQCTSNGTFGAATSCSGGLACEGAGLCRCSTGSRQCNGANLLVCSRDRTSFTLSDTCDSNAACLAATGPTCPDCTEGQCVNGQPFSCNGGQLVPAAACGAGLNCVGAGLCRCQAGEPRCSEGTLQECNDNGTAFVLADNACDGGTLRFCNGGTLGTLNCFTGPLCNASSPAGCATCLVDGNCDEGQTCIGTPPTCQPIFPPP